MFCNYASVTFDSSRMENPFQCTCRHSKKDDFWTTFRPMLGLSQDLWIRALKSKQKWLGYLSLFLELMSPDDDSDDKDGGNNVYNGNYNDNENSADDNPKPKSTKKGSKGLY